MEDPASVSLSSTPQDDLNQGSPQPASVPEPPVSLPSTSSVEPPLHPLPETPPVTEVPTGLPPTETPLPPLPETPPAPVPGKSEPQLGPKQLEETPPPSILSSTEPPLVFRNPEEKGGNKPRKPYLIGGAILMFLVFSSALAYYFFQKGGLGFQKKAAEGDHCTYGEACTVDGHSGTHSCTGTIQGGTCKYNSSVAPNCSACTYCGDGSCGGGEGADNCPADCGGGGGGITCGADGSGIWVKNTGTSATTVAVSWFASYCDRTDCFCSGGPSNENFTLQPGQTISRGFTNAHPACNWSWQTDVTAGSCHQSAHGCGSESCVTPTQIPTPTSAIVTGIATGTIPKPTATPTPKPTSTPTPPPVPPTRPPATPTPTATNTPTPTPTKSPLCIEPVQITTVSAGTTSTKITVISSYGYTDVELRVTSGGVVTPYQNPTVQGFGSWVWTVPKSLSSIISVAFYVDVSSLGQGGAVCGSWSPPTPTPTTPLLACVDVEVAVTGGGDLNSLKIGSSLSFLVTFGGTVEDVGIVIKKEGIRVKTLTAGGSQTNSWTSPSYTIDSLGSYEILGYIKTNGTWR